MDVCSYYCFFFLMIRRPPRSTRTDTSFPTRRSSDLIGTPLDDWMAPEGTTPEPVAIEPPDGFNIIYSSGTTGTPKGIVHSHAMRWQHIQRGVPAYGPQAVTILSTPLYSNTTMASFLPTVGSGGQTVLMKKFDAHRSEEHTSELQ